jgi:two-component system LytT family response regulator
MSVNEVRVLIADDEQLARQQLRRFASASPGVRVVAECESGPEAVSALSTGDVDLALLDVQMPGMDGFEVVEAVGAERMPHVVFVTAYQEHAIRAFRAHAMDYLLKPVDPEQLSEAIERVRARLGPAPVREKGAHLRRFVIRTDRRLYMIPSERIDWIESRNNDVILHEGSATHRLRGTLTALMERLDPARFVRLHRSAAVNLERVREVQPWFHGDYIVLLNDGTRLTVGRSYREAFLAALGG